MCNVDPERGGVQEHTRRNGAYDQPIPRYCVLRTAVVRVLNQASACYQSCLERWPRPFLLDRVLSYSNYSSAPLRAALSINIRILREIRSTPTTAERHQRGSHQTQRHASNEWVECSRCVYSYICTVAYHLIYEYSPMMLIFRTSYGPAHL